MDSKRAFETADLEQKRNVFLEKYRMPVNTDLQRADEIEYAMETQLLQTPKDNYVGLTDVKKPVTQIAKEALQKVPWQSLQNAASSSLGMPQWLTKNQFMRGLQANLVNLAREIPAQALTQGNMLDTALGNKERAEKWTNIMSELRDPSRAPETLLKEVQKTKDFLSGNPAAAKNPFVYDPNDEEFKHKMQLWEDNQKRIDQFNQRVKVIAQDFMERTGIARTEQDGWLYDAGAIGSSLLSTVALLVAFRNPGILAGIYGAAEAQGVYEDAIEAGIEPGKAYGLGTIAGGVNAILEQIGGESLLAVMNAKGTITKAAARALAKSGNRSALTATALGAARGAGVEGVEEALQNVATDVIENLGDVQKKQATDIIKDALKAGVMGSIGGFFGSGPTAYANYVNYQQQIQTALEGVGVPREAAAAIARETANEATSKELSGEVMDALEAEVNSPLTAEQRDVKAFAQVLTERQQREIDRTAWKVGDKIEQDSLKTGMAPAVAKANGQVAQILTNNIFRLSSLTPADFENFKIEVINDGAQPLNAPILTQPSVEQFNQLPPAAYDKNGKADTNAPAFKQWFGNSKVVDENGQPLEVYHGTRSNFDTFDFSRTGQNFGGYNAYKAGMDFSANRDRAIAWGRHNRAGEGLSFAMPVYLKIENPFRYSPFKNSPYYSSTKPNAIELKKQGYDGIIDYTNPEALDYVVFEPTQIKSVYNKGTFDKNNPDIYYQPGYHGSRADFDNFNLSFLGTGEGAQAHGWGLYFAGNKEVAEKYRRFTSQYNADNWQYDKQPVYKYLDIYPADMGFATLEDTPAAFKEKLRQQIASARANFDQYLYPNYYQKWDKAYQKLLQMDEKKLTKKEQGQLYRVDLPENDVLLDEEKPFIEQPKKVQEALLSLGEDEEVLPQLTNQENWGLITGREIYETLSANLAVADGEIEQDERGAYTHDKDYYNKAASLLLNKYGIKGITYQGAQDGRCFVVFDDQAIEILQTFYQPGMEKLANLTEIHNQVTGEAIPLEVNEKLHEFTPVELDNDFLPMAENTAAGKRQVLNTIFAGKPQIKIEKDGKTFTLTHGSIKKMLNTSITAAKEYAVANDLPNAQRRQLYREATEQVVQAQKVFRTAQLVLSHKDVKNVSGRTIHRYANTFVYKGKPYYAMFVAKQDGTLTDLHLYDLQTEQKAPANGQGQNPAGTSNGENAISQQAEFENNAPAGNSSGANTSSQQRAPISIAEIVDFVKRKIAKYNNNVDEQTFNQDNATARGQVQINEKARTAIIKIFAGKSDPSTVVHELAHVYLAMLNNASRISTDPEFHTLIKDLNAWLGDPAGPNGAYNVEQQEKFARSFEAYLAQGKAPNAKLQNIFEKFAQWLAEVYKGVKDYLKITPEVSALFDRLMTIEEPVKKARLASNTQRAKELLQAIKTGSKIENSLELADMKTLLKTASTRRPGKPKTHLLKELRAEGANYNNTARIDKEAYANAGVKNKKSGIGDDLARWMIDHNYMSAQDAQTYEDQSALDDAAADLIDRALSGEEIYRLDDQERVAQIEAYDENLRALQEVFPNLIGVADTERAIAALEAQGYRVVDKQDIERLEKEQARLDALLEKQSSKQNNKQGDDKALNRQAQQIRDALLNELDRRALENKEQLKNWLSLAQNPEQIREAVGNVLDYLEQEYVKTPEGQAEQSKLEVPHTDYAALKIKILRDLNRINKQNADKVKEAREVIDRTGKILARNVPLNSEEEAARKKAFQTLKNVLDNPYRQAIAAATAGIRHLPAADKGKFLRTFISQANIKNLPNEVDSILRRAQEIEIHNYKKYMEGKIEELMQRKLFSKSGTLRTALLDQQSTAAMLALRRFYRMTPEAAAQELEARTNEEERLLKDPDQDPAKLYTPIRVLENGMLSLRAESFDDVPPALFKKVYDGLNELHRGGKDQMAVQKMVKDWRTQEAVREVKKAVNLNKKAGLLKKLYHRLMSNWESSLNMVTSQDVREKYSMLNAEADTQVYINQRRRNIMEGVKRAYGIADNWKANYYLSQKIKELDSETYTVTNYGLVDRNPDPAAIRKEGEPFEEKLTKVQIITMYIWNMNPVLSARLHSSYGEAQLNYMFNTVLTKQDKALGVLLQREAEKTYDFINEVFIRERGYALPRVQNYFPSKALRVESDLDLLVAFAAVSKNPSFLKSRVDSARIMMKPSNPFSLLFQHIDTAADYHFKAEKINQIRRVFRNLSVKQTIEAKFGEAVYKQLLGHIDQMTAQRAQARYDVDKVGDWLTNNFVRGAIAARPAITIKQLISSINYAEQMPAAEWAKGFARAIARPKQTIQFMLDGDPYLKTRFESGSMNEALAHVMAIQKQNISKGFWWQQFDALMTLNTRLGDVGAIIFGGKPLVDHLMKVKGLTKEQAFAEFRKSTLRSQQASTRSSLSAYQAQNMNWLMRALYSFKNTPQQYARKIADALVQYQRGEIGVKQLGKNVAIYALLNSWLYSVLTDLWLAQLGFGDDDDDAIATALNDTFAGPLTQLAGALPILDVGVEEALRFITAKSKDENFKFRATTLPVIDDLVKLGNQSLKEDMEFEDVMTLLAEMGQTFGGIPTRYFKAAVKGTADVVTGKNPMRGFLQLLGYTEHRAKKVTGSED